MPQNRITPLFSVVTDMFDMALTLLRSGSMPCLDITCPMKVIFDSLNLVSVG